MRLLRNSSDAAVFDQAYDAARSDPESRGYDWVLAATSAVLRVHGIDMDAMALSTIYHDPLAHFASGPRPTLDQVAKTMDGFWDRVTRTEPAYESPRRYVSTYWSQDTRYVDGEIARHLKEEKARRGSRKYRELLGRMKAKAIAAQTEENEKKLQDRNHELERQLERDAEQLVRLVSALDRTHEMIRVATVLIEAAGYEVSAGARAGMQHAVANRRKGIDELTHNREFVLGVTSKGVDEARAEAERWWAENYESLTPNDGAVRYTIQGVLAGAYRGRDISQRALLTHAVIQGESRSLCRRMDADRLTGWDEGNRDEPTCPVCAERLARIPEAVHDPEAIF